MKDLSASISGFSLVSVAQMVEIEKITCRLRVSSQRKEGFLYFVEGHLVAAETGVLSGNAAASEIVKWTHAVIDADGRWQGDAKPKTIDQSLMTIVLDALSRDEGTRGTASTKADSDVHPSQDSRQDSDVPISGKDGDMNALQATLEKFRSEVPEFVSTDIVNVESGLSIGGGSIESDFDASVASASYAEVVKANARALDLLGLGAESTEDILISTQRVYLLIRLLGSEYYHVLAISRRGNLGLARVLMKKYQPALLRAVGELA